MSVFTPVSEAQLEVWLKQYTVGQLVSLEGISAGVQNSNFFVTTTLGRYVLTLVESTPRAQLPFFLYLTAHLAHHGLPVPAPVANRDNEYLGTLNDRPAVLVARLSGQSDLSPDAARCARAGAMMAGLHLAGLSYGRKQDNPRNAAWRAACGERVMPFLSEGDQQMLADELTFQARQDYSALPHGVVHADMFRDNVLWDGDFIGGVIDFYFAGYDTLLYDVAVTLNDWCTRADGTVDPVRATALLNAYRALRPFTAEECAAWPAVLRAAALRFWLSRAEDKYLPKPGEMVLVHNPDVFRDILAAHRQHTTVAL